MHARPSARPPINMSGNCPVPMSASHLKDLPPTNKKAYTKWLWHNSKLTNTLQMTNSPKQRWWLEKITRKPKIIQTPKMKNKTFMLLNEQNASKTTDWSAFI